MKYSYKHSSVRLTGRWDITSDECAITTAPGSYIEIAFRGKLITLLFNIKDYIEPVPHIYVQLDGGAMTECLVDDYMRVMAADEGEHICKIIFMSAVEFYNRWEAPLQSKVAFVGYLADGASELREDTRRTIEFVGDSITEGVLVDPYYYGEGGQNKYEKDLLNRPYQDDTTATYASISARELDLRQINMGYGAVGVTKGGVGGVPAAHLAYPYNFAGSPISRPSPDFIVINHGANDRSNGVEKYIECYEKLLDVIREHNPKSKIIVLSAFCGFAREELCALVERYNEKNNDNVYFIDGGAWVPPQPIHPTREGHRIVAKNLIPIMREIIK